MLAAVRGYLDALSAGDWAGACARLDASVHRDLAARAGDGSEGGDCTGALEALLGNVDRQALAARLRGAELGPALVAADRAEVEIPTPESPIRLRKVDGEWRIAQLRFASAARAAQRLESIEPL